MTSDKTLNRMAIASLLYGGFLLIAYLFLAYTGAWVGEFAPRGGRIPTGTNPTAILLSPPAVILIVSGVGFVANGMLLLRYGKRKEKKETREFTISTMLTDDERAVFDALRHADGSATQKNLSNQLGYSAVKMHRVLSRLEQKNVVKSFPFGMTKKIIISDAQNP